MDIELYHMAVDYEAKKSETTDDWDKLSFLFDELVSSIKKHACKDMYKSDEEGG